MVRINKKYKCYFEYFMKMLSFLDISLYFSGALSYLYLNNSIIFYPSSTLHNHPSLILKRPEENFFG